MKKSTVGFTLVEILVVVTILAILASVIYANFNEGSAQSRDAKRKADLITLQSAIELYRQDNGRYPEGCNGTDGENWSGQIGTSYACSGGNSQYIVDLAPKYIKVLPTDPKPGTGDYGYVYLTNPTGTVYKLVARNSVETATEIDLLNSYEHEFSACSVKTTPPPGNNPFVTDQALTSIPSERNDGNYALAICNAVNTHATCNLAAGAVRNLGLAPFTDCNLTNIKTSYAVWGGFGNPADIGGTNTEERKIECLTERVICKMPPKNSTIAF